MNRIKSILVVLLSLVLGTGPAFSQATAARNQDNTSRIKDLADFEGIRDNMLVGYGIVVGLNATGDKLTTSPFTTQTLQGMLERLGVNVKNGGLDTKNVAAVMVTANLPPFARPGTRIDVVVSALGDSKSLLGGTLIVTPLLAADGEVYAVAQGPMAVSGFSGSGAAASATKGVPTSARIPNGAIVERGVDFQLRDLAVLNLALRDPDLTTATRVAETINGAIGRPVATPLDTTAIQISVPGDYPGGTIGLMTEIERLPVQPDQVARIMINQESGTIVISQEVRVSPVAIAQGSITVKVTEAQQVSQPGAFATAGTTQVVDRTQVEVNESGTGKVALFNRGASLQDIVDGLNALGISPRDLISIIQALKASGALRAELIMM